MLTLNFENVHDISVDTSRTETTVSFRFISGGSDDLKMDAWVARLMIERVTEALGKVST